MNYYLSENYDDERRWASYWHQINEVVNFKPRSVLVVGKGNGLVAEYFKLTGIKTITLDIDQSLKPDVIASVLDMPFGNNHFDVILCAQVLEHLPYEDFGQALKEINRVAKNSVVISLPHFGPTIKFLLKLPFLPEIKFLLKFPYPIRHIFKGEHHWEIGKRGYLLIKIKNEIKKSGFLIEKDYIVFENPLHHFFILKK